MVLATLFGPVKFFEVPKPTNTYLYAPVLYKTPKNSRAPSFIIHPPAGQQLIDKITPQFGPFYEQLSAHITEEEAATLNTLLDKVAAAVNASDM